MNGVLVTNPVPVLFQMISEGEFVQFSTFCIALRLSECAALRTLDPLEPRSLEGKKAAKSEQKWREVHCTPL